VDHAIPDVGVAIRKGLRAHHRFVAGVPDNSKGMSRNASQHPSRLGSGAYVAGVLVLEREHEASFLCALGGLGQRLQHLLTNALRIRNSPEGEGTNHRSTEKTRDTQGALEDVPLLFSRSRGRIVRSPLWTSVVEVALQKGRGDSTNVEASCIQSRLDPLQAALIVRDDVMVADSAQFYCSELKVFADLEGTLEVLGDLVGDDT
jgi:hypothetical protein